LFFENQRTFRNNLMKTEMKKGKMIVTLTGVFILLFSYVSISGFSDQPEGSDSDQTTTKSAQTKTTQTGSKSTQTKPKSAQTKSKTTQGKSKTTPKSPKPVPVKKSEYPGTVRIGTQAWAVANLNVNTFRNGDTIPEAKTNKEWVAAGESRKPAWCYYNNDPAIGLLYGKLYNWYAVNDPRGLAPAGWTLPSDADWAKLINYLGGPGPAGGKMKSTSRWNEGSNGTNLSGFTGFPAGNRIENGIFQNIGSIGIWWSSVENNPPSAIDHYLSISNSCNRSTSPKQRGESVRCIRE
jgi:uncharacterized protein (TIGR02145 family)